MGRASPEARGTGSLARPGTGRGQASARRERQSRLSSGPSRPAGLASTPSSPGFLPRIRRAAATCLLGLAALSAAGTSAQAQTPTSRDLVSNLGQTTSSSHIEFDSDLAQSFRTGASNEGYKLTRADIGLNGTTDTLAYTVTIRSNNSSNRPGTVVGTLVNPASLPDSDHTAQFTTTGIDLDARTTYWVMVDVSTGSSNAYAHLTSSDSEDTGGARGWTIRGDAYWRSSGSTGAWTLHSVGPMKIRIRGYDRDTTAPTFSSAIVETVTDSNNVLRTYLDITWSERLDNPSAGPTDFTVNVNGTGRHWSGHGSLEAGLVSRLWLTGTVAATDTVTLSYTKPTIRPLKDYSGNEMASFSNKAVTVPGLPAAPPAPSAVAIAGLGDRLSVSWSAPSNTGGREITDYDLRWYKGAADPEDEADWIEAGEAGGHDVVGAATKATVTGLDPSTAYRVQVRATNEEGTGPWSDSGGATTASRSGGSTPTSGALVSNTGQTSDQHSSFTSDHALRFTTGGNGGGYKLTGLQIKLREAGTATYRVQIRNSAGSNPNFTPGTTTLGTLTNPATLAVGLNTFTAPGSGIDLAANTSYFVLLDVDSVGGDVPGITATSSNAEDAGKEAGWSIFSNMRIRSNTATSWGLASNTNVLQIAIHGYAKGVPYAPETPTVRAVSGLGDRLTVRWREPSVEGGGAVTGYDLRYYKGAADPEDEADWIESGEAGGLDHVGTATKATLTGLDALTIYRVQVRAVAASGNGPWSASGVATTAAWSGSVGGVLVSNTGQTRAGAGALDRDIAQSFATGSNAGGYKLTRVDLQFEVGNPSGSTGASYSVEIWSTNHGASYKPVTRVGTLTNPSSLSAGLNTFTASGAGIDLNADAHYTVVVDASSAGNRQESLVGTSSNAEDGVARWYISDGGDVRTGSTWVDSSWKWKVAIHGYTKTASTSGASPGALVGNTGQAAASTTLTLRGDNAQPFTTGGNGNGYKLTAVKMSVTGGSVEPTYTAKIFRAASNGQPTGSSLGTLTNPSSLATSGTKTWTASGGGIDLDANTGYVLVLDASALGGPGFDLTHTESDAEDAGASAGWSIDNSSFGRSFASSTWILRASSVQIAIHGYAKAPPPAPAAPSVSAVPLQPDRLSVQWSPPAGAPATDYDLRWYRGSEDPEDEADWIEAGEPGGHDHAGVLRTATLTGLLPSTTYRVQVRAVNDNGAGSWSASGSGRTAGEVSAWGSAAVEVLVGNFREPVTALHPLAPHDRAQGFTTDGPPLGHALGYTVTSVDLQFATAPDPGVRVRLVTGASTSSAGTTLATLRNPAHLSGGGANTFTAPRGTTLDPNTGAACKIPIGTRELCNAQ